MSRNSLTRYTAWHLRIRRLVQFIFVGAIYHNALTICAALLCRALRRVNRMCSRTVSGTANMSGYGSTLCSPTVEKLLCRSPFRSGHMSVSCARPSQKEVGVKRVETLVSTLLPPPRGAARSRRRRRRTPAEVQRKTHRPLGANRLRGSCAPDNRCRKRCCPDRAYCCATRVPSILCAEKERNSCFCAKKARSSLRKSAKSRIVGIKI